MPADSFCFPAGDSKWTVKENPDERFEKFDAVGTHCPGFVKLPGRLADPIHPTSARSDKYHQGEDV